MAFTALVSPPPDAPPGGRWYLVGRDQVLVAEDDLDDGGMPIAGADPVAELKLEGAGAPDGPAFLGTLDGQPCWALGVAADTVAPPGWRWEDLHAIGRRWDTVSWALAGRAVQLIEWIRTNRYCGRCGTPTVALAGERAMRCPSCALLSFPRLAPAIIVLVRRGKQALLGRNGRFAGNMFSTLAGFVEPGETLEEAVHREVAEEVGVRLGDVRYFGSQPWPFPHSLMVGFMADWASGDIAVDGEEIVEARWFSPSELPPIPPSISIARRLIDQWIAEVS